MRQETALEKKKKNKALIDSGIIIKIKDFLYPLMMFLTKTKVSYKIKKVNICKMIEGKPVIFVANHGAFYDTPIVLKATGKRSYILSGLQKLYFIDWIFFTVNGAVWVDRKNKKDMSAVKDVLLQYLKKGQSILWFPEGTWNLTPDKLMLPMKWGIIDIAHKADAQIIPVVLHYNKESLICSVKFAPPMYGDDFTDKQRAICTLRDTMATMRWEFISSEGIIERNNWNDIANIRHNVYAAIDEYPPLDWQYECSCIYQPYEKIIE